MNKNIDIKVLYEILNKNRKYIIKFTLIFFVFSLFYSFSSTNFYKSTITLYAAGELDESSLLSKYGSLVENFGISITPSSNYYIPDIIDSRSLKKEIVLKKWNNYKFDKSKNLIEYWKINEIGFISSILKTIKGIFISNQFYDINISQLNAAIKKIDNLIYVDEQNSGLIIVTVHMEEPELASEIANYISQYVVDFIKNQQKSFANKTKEFVLERMNLAKVDLEKSEVKLTEFRKTNPLALDTPDLQLIRARYMRDVKVNQQIFITLREQLEIAKIESNKERLYINILDNAYPDPERAKPKRLLLIFIFTFCGFIGSILFQVVRFNFKINKTNT